MVTMTVVSLRTTETRVVIRSWSLETRGVGRVSFHDQITLKPQGINQQTVTVP